MLKGLRRLQWFAVRSSVSRPWLEVVLSTVSSSLLFLVPSFSAAQFEYSFVYV